MKFIFVAILMLFTIEKSNGQTAYTLGNNNVSVSYNIFSVTHDSIEVKVKLNNNSDCIWVSEKPYLFDPKIRNQCLYLNLGFDLGRYALMDIAPFPLRKIGEKDSLIISQTIKKEDYKNISVICSYISEKDYKKIIKIKKNPEKIGFNDYYDYVKMLTFELYVK